MKTQECITAIRVMDSVISGDKPDFEEVLEVRVALRRTLTILEKKSAHCSEIVNRPKKSKKKKKNKKKGGTK